MARINEKRQETSKPKLASVIWSFVVVGILSAVVITGIVLLIVYLVSLGNTTDEETKYDAQFPDATSITYEDLESLFNGTTARLDYNAEGLTYVLVYSDEFELSDDLKAAINEAYGSKGFYLLNTYAEENEESSFLDYDYLATITVPTLSSTKPAYLLMFESYELDEENIPNSTSKIKQAINNFLG